MNEGHFHNPSQGTLWQMLISMNTLPSAGSQDEHVLSFEGQDGTCKFCSDIKERTEVLPGQAGHPRPLQPLNTLLPPPGLQLSHKASFVSKQGIPRRDNCRRKFSPKSTSTSHQDGFYSMAIRAMPLKASFRFMCSSLLSGSHNSPGSLIYHPITLFL
jgi:hypothetical protein